MNVVKISGRLTRDAEIRYLGASRYPLCSLNVAVDDAHGRWNRETGKTEVGSGFYSVEIFGQYGEALSQQLSKGDEVFVEGSLSQWTQQPKDGGESVTRTRIRAEVVIPKTVTGGTPIAAPSDPPVDEPGWTGDDVPF